ncbi:MAG TPA: DUF4350 domain-containing protein [Holophagaceae bacterium]|nr:DUF4350 domain-containing protein [Holophagaceae bacterium]
MARPARGADRMRILGLLLLGLLTLGALGWYVARNLEVKQERVWVGYHGEARTDDFLAAVRLLGRLGREAHAVRGVPLPKTLGATDALILPSRHLRMTPGQVAGLKAWVAGGGLLVAEGTFAEDPDSDRVNDPLFEAFGARLVKNGLKAPESGKGEDYDDWQKRVKAFEQEHGVEEVGLNGSTSRVDLGAYHRLAYVGSDDALGAGGKMLFLREGEGSVFLFTHLDALRNGQIGDEDHADFLAALVSRRPAEAKVWLVYEEEPPSLAAWLKANAWMVLLSLGLLTALFLWRGLRRLGPRFPDPALDRRSLLEHLAAAGRFQWSLREGEALLAAAQAALAARLRTAHPALAALPPDRQVAALAERSGLPEAQVFQALRYGRHADARDFTDALHTLERLRNLL